MMQYRFLYSINKLLPALGALALCCAPATQPAQAQQPPIRWETPASFDPSIAGLGLPQLPGVTYETLYAPFASKAPPEDGGNGRYESLLHGTYNHHTQAVIYNDNIIVYWTNHARDENGPGQRLLARWGTVSADRNSIDWGTPKANLVELVPPPAPALRREPLEEVKDRRYVEGHLQVVDGRLRVTGPISIYHGWTNDLKFRTPLEPIPDEHFRELRDNRKGFTYDMRWDTGSRFYQEWTFADGKLIPATPLYLDKVPASALQLTPKQELKLGPLLEAYRDAPLLSSLPPGQREFFTKRVRPVVAGGKPRAGYAKDARHLAANGKHGLAHMASFQRRDGMCIIVRDNLADPQCYFAAEAPPGGQYPPAIKTNLYGYAMPAAGELPDGTAWILGNSNERLDFYITTSRDGRVFDRTWEVCHDATYWVRGLFKPLRSGPQYPYALQIGNAIWVFHSVGKEQIAAVRIPYVSLYRTEELVARDGYPNWRSSHPGAFKATERSLQLLAEKQPCSAWLPLPPVQLAQENAGVRVRFQFVANRSFGLKSNTLLFGLFKQGAQGGASGYTASLTPVADSGVASVSILKQGAGVPGGAATLATNADFHRKLVKRQKYDVEFAIEKTSAGALVSIRIFGGDMPQPVEAHALDKDTPVTAFDMAALILGGPGIPDITITNVETIRFRTPSDAEIPSGSSAHESQSAAETSAIHNMMSQ